MNLNGVLVIDKPSGPTSHDVVARVRRATGEKRVGHTGTLDPLATGVLALVIGRATRLAQFLSNDDKEYIASVRLGMSTPTYDAEGLADFRLKPEATEAGAPTRDVRGFRLQLEGLDAALAYFRGTYLQTPPPFSAKKVAGTRAYRHARKQQAVELKPVEVTVHALDLVAVEGDRLELRIVCSSGFYVRTLAHELGRHLGCGAHLEALRRTRAGEFTVEQSVPLAVVEREGATAGSRLIPLERLLPALPAVTLNARGLRRAVHGNTIGPDDVLDPGGLITGFPPKIRLFDPDGGLLAIAESQPGGALHPTIVLV